MNLKLFLFCKDSDLGYDGFINEVFDVVFAETEEEAIKLFCEEHLCSFVEEHEEGEYEFEYEVTKFSRIIHVFDVKKGIESI